VQFGLTVSILMHLAILAWAFLSLQSPEPFRVPEPEPVEVALVTPEDIVRLKKGDRSAKQLEAQQADNQKKAVKEDKVKSNLNFLSGCIYCIFWQNFPADFVSLNDFF